MMTQAPPRPGSAAEPRPGPGRAADSDAASEGWARTVSTSSKVTNWKLEVDWDRAGSAAAAVLA